MKEPGNDRLSREGYWILGILGLAFVSLLVRLQNPYRMAPERLQVILAFIAAPTVFAVVLVLAPRPDTRVGLYVRRATLGLLLAGIAAPGMLAFFMVMAPVAWLVAYLLAKDKEGLGHSNAPLAPSNASIPATGATLAATTAATTGGKPSARPEQARRRIYILLSIVLSFTIVSFAGRAIYVRNLETTSLMFVGIPAVLAATLVVLVRPKSAMGTAMTGTTFVLLLSAILFGEGLICVLMAAPIFYIVGAVIGAVMQGGRDSKSTTRMMLLAPILLMTLEGTSRRLSLAREQSVTVTRVVAAQRGEIANALAAPLRFQTDLPLYLKMGFPRPVSASGAGLTVGSQRVIGFAGGEGKPGALVMEVVETAPERIMFRAVTDKSKIAHWLRWEDAVVRWRQIDEKHVEVEWTLHYQRNVDPAWYFEPWERYATRLATEYLMDNVIGKEK